MNRLIVAALVVAAALLTPTAHAQSSANGTFNVNINLTSSCALSAINSVQFNYTSFGGAQAATGGDFTVRCTNQLPYTLGLQAGTGAVVLPGSPTLLGITDLAVALQYDLGLSPATAPGTGAIQNYNVTGNMAAGQGGTCATPGGACTNASSGNRTHTLILSW